MLPSKFGSDGYYRVSSKDDIPTTPHYAIFMSTSVFIPGDERSQQCPGHGYPAETKYYVDYLVFENKQKWENYIKTYTKNHSSWKPDAMLPAFITPATISTEVNVNIQVT